jgi:hypothetical protein
MSFLYSIKQVKKTAKLLSISGLKKKIPRYIFKPIDYTRTREIPAVIAISGILNKKESNLKILDISSPQILSATLGCYSENWKITYLNPYDPELEEMEQIKSLLDLKNINVKKIDFTKASDLVKLGEKYDYIFSASVFEHIHPEIGGDESASKNVKGQLVKEGIFVISVPFYKIGFNEYKIGDSYSIKGSPNKKIFFQRFYDYEKLNKQIILPTRLELQSKLFLGERFYFPNNIHKRFAQLVQSRLNSVLFGKLFFMLSAIFMEKCDSYNKLKKPYIAALMLRNEK